MTLDHSADALRDAMHDVPKNKEKWYIVLFQKMIAWANWIDEYELFKRREDITTNTQLNERLSAIEVCRAQVEFVEKYVRPEYQRIAEPLLDNIMKDLLDIAYMRFRRQHCGLRRLYLLVGVSWGCIAALWAMQLGHLLSKHL